MSIPFVPLDIGEATAGSVELGDLTTGSLTGTGVFDVLMNVVGQHVANEFDKGRVTGKEYATVYLGSMATVLQASVAYLTSGKEVEKLNAEIGLIRQKTVTELAVTDDTIPIGLGFNGSADVEGSATRQNSLLEAQANALVVQEALIAAQTALYTAQSLSETAKIALTEAQITTYGPQNELTASQTALHEAQASLAETQATVIPSQIAHTTAQTSLTTAQATVIPAQIGLLEAQTDSQAAQAVLYPAQVGLTEAQTAGEIAKATLIPKQVILSEKQAELTVAQASLQTAQALIVPAQGDLYLAQKAGYDRDAEQKLAKILVDTWVAQRATDQDTPANAYNHLDDNSIGAVIQKAKNGIGVV